MLFDVTVSASGPLTVRADSGFWSRKLIDRLDAHDAKWSITVTLGSAVRTAIQAIPDDAWADIAYTKGGHAQVAETDDTTGRGKHRRSVRSRHADMPLHQHRDARLRGWHLHGVVLPRRLGRLRTVNILDLPHHRW